MHARWSYGSIHLKWVPPATIFSPMQNISPEVGFEKKKKRQYCLLTYSGEANKVIGEMLSLHLIVSFLDTSFGVWGLVLGPCSHQLWGTSQFSLWVAHSVVTLSLQASHLPAESMRIVLERCYNDLRLLSVPSKTLKAEGFFRSNKVCHCLFIVSSLLAANGVKLNIY